MLARWPLMWPGARLGAEPRSLGLPDAVPNCSWPFRSPAASAWRTVASASDRIAAPPSTLRRTAKRLAHGLLRPGSRPSPHVSAPRARSRSDLRRQRRRRPPTCYDHLLLAPLWPLYDANLGTLLRTCDAVGACLVVPRRPSVDAAVAKGNTLRRGGCVHRVREPIGWLGAQRAAGTATHRRRARSRTGRDPARGDGAARPGRRDPDDRTNRLNAEEIDELTRFAEAL
jgi:hypothetical protein